MSRSILASLPPYKFIFEPPTFKMRLPYDRLSFGTCAGWMRFEVGFQTGDVRIQGAGLTFVIQVLESVDATRLVLT